MSVGVDLRWRDWTAIAIAVGALALAVLALARGVGSGPVGAALGVVVALAGLTWAAYRSIRRYGGGVPSIQPPTWSPERSRQSAPVSGRDLLEPLESAAASIGAAEDIPAATETVRPVLRDAVIEVYAASGDDRSTAERALSSGEWTDDRAAAAVLDPSIDPPTRSLPVRIERWLFPERVFRRRVHRAVDAIARTADRRLPVVAGQFAPRPVPITDPPLSELRRTVEGDLARPGEDFRGRSE
ncbi:MAG: hypothetical protein ABEJ86_00875 [Halococcoides sp.]